MNFKTQEFAGIEYNIANEVAKSLNLLLMVHPPSVGKGWGRRQKDGTWSGVVGEMHRGEADIVWAHLYATQERREIMTFTQWYFMDPTCILVPRSSDTYTDFYSAVQPFGFGTWLGVFLVIITMTLNLLIHQYVTNQSLNFNHHLTTVIGVTLSQYQGRIMVIARKKIYMKIAVGIYLLGTFILQSAYAGSLKSMLMVVLYPPPCFDGLAARINQGEDWRIQSCCSAMKTALRMTTRQSMKAVAEQVDIYGWGVPNYYEKAFSNVSDTSLAMGQNQYYAIMATKKDLRLKMRQFAMDDEGKVKMHIMEDCFNPISIALGLGKNSPYREAINHKMSLLIEGGIVVKWMKDSDIVNSKIDVYEEHAFSLEQFEGPFVVLFLFGGLSIFSFLVEVIIVKCK